MLQGLKDNLLWQPMVYLVCEMLTFWTGRPRNSFKPANRETARQNTER